MPRRTKYQDILDIEIGAVHSGFLCTIIVVLSLFTVSSLYARVELVGVMENSYRRSESADKYSKSGDFTEYLQNYQLGFKGTILSPKFCSYFLGGRYEESQKTSGDVFWRTRTKTLYDFTGNFIRNRPISLDLFAKRSDIEIILQFKDTGTDRGDPVNAVIATG